MKLLLTTDAVGGIWRYSVDLARGLAERRVDVILAVLGPAPTPTQEREARDIPRLDLVRTSLPLDWTAETPAALAEAGSRLATLASLMGVSAAHLHAPALLGEARWHVPCVVVAHSCVGTWWNAMRSGPPPPDFRWRMTVTAQGLSAAAAVIAPSRAHAEAIRAVYGPRQIDVVHNGARPREPTRRSRPRAVLTAGRLWDEGKGVATLDRVASALDAPVRAAGPLEGPNGARIALANIEPLGVLDRPGMTGAFDEASVFASLARYEPFGLSVLEAAQSGLRLVLSDIPTFRELWDGVATFAGRDDDLAAVLRKALDTPGDGGAAVHATRYTLDAMTEGTLTVHRRLLAHAAA